MNPKAVPQYPDHLIEQWLNSARWAPSGFNLQPWKVTWSCHSNSISLRLSVDREKAEAAKRIDPSLSTSFVALGAFAETLVRTARLDGYVESAPSGGNGPNDFTLDLQAGIAPVPTAATRESTLATIKTRRTNRGLYLREPLTQAQLDALRSVDQKPFSSFIFTERAQVDSIAEELVKADSYRFKNGQLLREFLSTLRYENDPSQRLDGIIDSQIGVPAPARLGLKILKYSPSWFVRALARGFGAAIFKATAGKLFRNSGAILVIQELQDLPTSWFHLGRCMQSSWLLLTELGLVAQPIGITSLLFEAARSTKTTSADNTPSTRNAEQLGFSTKDLQMLQEVNRKLFAKFGVDLGRPCIAMRIGLPVSPESKDYGRFGPTPGRRSISGASFGTDGPQPSASVAEGGSDFPIKGNLS